MATEDIKRSGSFQAISHRFIETNGLRMHIAEQGTGPLILLCHGFPECWYSWRYQIAALAEAGYHVVAPDQRGYGQTDRPDAVEVYTMLHLVGDLMGLLDALGEQEAILVGHDWGAVVTWNAALMRPDRFRPIITMSVPYVPRGPVHGESATVPPSQAWKRALGGRFFYVDFFQTPGVAEAALEREVRMTMRRLLYGLSGDAAPAERWHPVLPASQASFFNSAGDPAVLPAWLSEKDLDIYTAEFQRSGFRGGLNWYRNIDRNWELLAAFSGARVLQPTLSLQGDQDPTFEDAGAERRTEQMERFVPHLRKVMLPGAGHWLQQERSAEVNEAILTFLGDL